MAWTAKILGADEVAPAMREAVETGTAKGLERLGVKCAQIVQENILSPYGGKPAAKATGNLAGSITASFTREATMMREVIGVRPVNQANVYAAPVETGTRPHMPPVSALVLWVKQKFHDVDEKSAVSIAWAVAKKISKVGTSGHEMFSRALAEIEPIAPDWIGAEIDAALAEAGFKF